jgi:phytoene desaturase
MEKSIAALAPSDVPGFRRFLSENRTKLSAMEPCLETPFLGWQDLVNTRLLKMLPMLRPHQSVDTYLKRFFKDERVRLAFCFQSKYLGMSPFRCPSLFSILSFLEYEYGVWHPIGGCAAVCGAMARVARNSVWRSASTNPWRKSSSPAAAPWASARTPVRTTPTRWS